MERGCEVHHSKYLLILINFCNKHFFLKVANTQNIGENFVQNYDFFIFVSGGYWYKNCLSLSDELSNDKSQDTPSALEFSSYASTALQASGQARNFFTWNTMTFWTNSAKAILGFRKNKEQKFKNDYLEVLESTALIQMKIFPPSPTLKLFVSVIVNHFL